ncbi:DUF84 family protein [Bacillus piscicola]|uniref:DUF84 family protein n=1 Tax=Bacillus piscicola TaxID=1632684 RepID=UPI003083FCB5
MIIGIGSNNEAKKQAVAAVFSTEKHEITSCPVKSTVSAQPFSEEETKTGAVNRAKAVMDQFRTDIGIGLEGGVQPMSDGLYLCNWGALTDQGGNVFTAAGAKILLPKDVANGLYEGKELKTVMIEYTEREGISHHEGAVGIFSNGKVERADMFAHIVSLLHGQWLFFTQN